MRAAADTPEAAAVAELLATDVTGGRQFVRCVVVRVLRVCHLTLRMGFPMRGMLWADG